MKRSVMGVTTADWEKIQVGDIIYQVNGELMYSTVEQWSISKGLAIGVVAYIRNNDIGVMALDIQTRLKWGGYGTLVSGCTTASSRSTAGNDYSGYNNTKAIVDSLGDGSNYAAGYCWNYGLGDQQWYLPAAGEVLSAISQKEVINPSLVAVGGVQMKSHYNNLWRNIQTSTQYNSTNMWIYRYYFSILDSDYHKDYYADTDVTWLARPFFRIIIKH